MKIKDYPPSFEKVFSGDEIIKKKCDINRVEVSDDTDLSLDQYMMLIKTESREFKQIIFDKILKLYWLFGKFVYMGIKKKRKGSTNFYVDRAFVNFLRTYTNFDYNLLCKTPYFVRVASYFDDFYPDFDIHSPFEYDYEFPYKHIGIEYMSLVYAMPERLELLKIADQRKMGINEFSDYVINYNKNYNEEHGDTYEYMFSSFQIPPYVRVIKPKKYARRRKK